ncbi:putative 3-oxoacyl-ACP synthase I [Streptomyces sp. Tu6071]|nr:putative 3-oxoacyl-ACP synthase I [Streptomyces sp. Tu6071]
MVGCRGRVSGEPEQECAHRAVPVDGGDEGEPVHQGGAGRRLGERGGELEGGGGRARVTDEGAQREAVAGEPVERVFLLLAEEPRRRAGHEQFDVVGARTGPCQYVRDAPGQHRAGPPRLLEGPEAGAEHAGEHGPARLAGALLVLQEEERAALAERLRVRAAVLGDPLDPGALHRELLDGAREQGRTVTAAQQPGGVLEGEQGGGRAARDGDVGALEAVPDRALSGGAVHDGVGETRRVDEVGLVAGERVPREVHDRLDAARGAEDEPGRLGGGGEAGPVLVQEHPDGRRRDPRDAVHGARALAAEHRPDVEAGDERRRLVGDRPTRLVHGGDGPLSVPQSLGELVSAEAVRRGHGPAGDHRPWDGRARCCCHALPLLSVPAACSGRLLPGAEHQDGVVAAEGQSVVLHDLQLGRDGFVGYAVDRALGVGGAVVDGGRDEAVPQRQGARGRGEGAGRAHGVADHRLDRDGARQVLAEDLPDRADLGHVVGPRAGAVRGDEVDVRGLDPGVAVRGGDAARDGVAVGGDRVARVAGQPVTEHFGVDRGAPGPRGLQRLHEEDAGALAGQDALPVGVEGTAHVGCDGAEPVEAREGLAAQRVGAAAQGHVDVSRADRVVAVADRVVPGRAGGGDRDGLDVLQPQLPDDARREPVRPHAPRGDRVERVLALGDLEGREVVEVAGLPVGRADRDEGAHGPYPLGGEPRVRDRHPARGGGELRGPAEVFGLLRLEPVGRLEVGDLARVGVGEARRVEGADGLGAAAPGPQAVREGVHPGAHARDDAEPGDDHPVPGRAIRPRARGPGRRAVRRVVRPAVRRASHWAFASATTA